MTVIDTFATVAGDRHGAARSWKEETGKKVFGYFTEVSPEEILFAANVLPIRITGTGEPLEFADQHLAANSCPFARSCLDAGMRGHYDYLDGVVVPNTCDVIFYMHDLWTELVPRTRMPIRVERPAGSASVLVPSTRSKTVRLAGWKGTCTIPLPSLPGWPG